MPIAHKPKPAKQEAVKPATHLLKENKLGSIILACRDLPLEKASGEKWTTNPDHVTCPKCLELAPKSKAPATKT